ncbi:MAG TPA: LCP family protein [Dermatophilaceae bacterium]|nr:LCP family protein [Dermatophilaceae bacterium]
MSAHIPRRAVLESLSGLGLLAALAACTTVTPTSATPGTSTPGQSSPPSSPPPTPSSTGTEPSATPTPSASPLPSAPLAAGHVNALVIGSDSRSEALDGSSDVLTLVQLTADRTRVNLVSIARDSAVPLPGGGQGKINAVYAGRGPAAAAASVSSLLGGLPIHYTLETGFSRFIRISELLGGFTVTNRQASNSIGITFPAGPLTLRGEPALLYVRERKGLANGDLDRTERHRAALTGILARLHELAIKDFGGVAAMLPALVSNVRMSGLTAEQAAGMLPLLTTLTPDAVSSVMVPVKGFGMVGGASVDIVNTSRTAELAAALARGDLAPYIAKYGTSNAPTG